MIRRDARLIGRKVTVTNPSSKWYGRNGYIKGFRGSQAIDKDVPYVQVYLISLGWIEPICATSLELIE